MWPFQVKAPAFALLIGEKLWVGFACDRWACVAGSSDLVEGWAKSAVYDRDWSHTRGWWATAGRSVPDLVANLRRERERLEATGPGRKVTR